MLAGVVYAVWQSVVDASPAVDYPGVEVELAVPVPEPVYFDSVTGLRMRCVPTDLTDFCEPYTDTIGGRR